MRFSLKITTAQSEIYQISDEFINSFRCYERLSGLDPSLDKTICELTAMTPEVSAPRSEFDNLKLDHDLGSNNRSPVVSPPYYFRVLISKGLETEPLFKTDLVSGSATVTLTSNDETPGRHFRGIILRSFLRSSNSDGASRLEICVYPDLWALSVSQKSRVWRDVRATDVLHRLQAEYLSELSNFSGIQDRRTGLSVNNREAVIQWNESDFEFLSRLLERDGEYYAFHHTEDQSSVIVMSHNMPTLMDYVPEAKLPFVPHTQQQNSMFFDAVSSCVREQKLVPKQYAIGDYNPLNAAVPLNYTTPPASSSAFEVYDYPAEVNMLSDLSSVSSQRLNALKAREDIYILSSKCPLVSAGHAVSSQTSFDEYNFMQLRPTQVVHEIIRDKENKPYYFNWFEAMEAQKRYSPTMRTPVPSIHGTHNAVVVTKNGLVADVDAKSRALVVFRWDREKTPVRVRLGQPWAGGSHGMHVLPREGDEVIVSFIQGNTERPIIVTSLHNSQTGKKYDPSQDAPIGFAGDTNPGEPRSQQLTTALHNAQGNALLFSEEKDKELVKLDAIRDFVIEIGTKVTGGQFFGATVENFVEGDQTLVPSSDDIFSDDAAGGFDPSKIKKDGNYEIIEAGSFNFQEFGAVNGDVGTKFKATKDAASATGTGKVKLSEYQDTTASLTSLPVFKNKKVVEVYRVVADGEQLEDITSQIQDKIKPPNEIKIPSKFIERWIYNKRIPSIVKGASVVVEENSDLVDREDNTIGRPHTFIEKDKSYKIMSLGYGENPGKVKPDENTDRVTDFRIFGASNNKVGTVFVANNNGNHIFPEKDIKKGYKYMVHTPLSGHVGARQVASHVSVTPLSVGTEFIAQEDGKKDGKGSVVATSGGTVGAYDEDIKKSAKKFRFYIGKKENIRIPKTMDYYNWQIKFGSDFMKLPGTSRVQVQYCSKRNCTQNDPEKSGHTWVTLQNDKVNVTTHDEGDEKRKIRKGLSDPVFERFQKTAITITLPDVFDVKDVKVGKEYVIYELGDTDWASTENSWLGVTPQTSDVKEGNKLIPKKSAPPDWKDTKDKKRSASDNSGKVALSAELPLGKCKCVKMIIQPYPDYQIGIRDDENVKIGFERDKEKRGTGIIRAYGDMFLVVGKNTESILEMRDGDGKFTGDKEMGVKKGQLDQKNRGDLVINAMAEIKQNSAAYFSSTFSAATKTLVEATIKKEIEVFKPLNFSVAPTEIESTASRSTGYSISESDANFEMSSGSGTSFGIGLQNEVSLLGGNEYSDLGIKMEVSGPTSVFSGEMGFDGYEITGGVGPLQFDNSFKPNDATENISASAVIDPVNSLTTVTKLTQLKLALGTVTTMMTLTHGALTLYVKSIIDDAPSGEDEEAKKQLEKTLREFLEKTLVEMGTAFNSIFYAATLVQIGYATFCFIKDARNFSLKKLKRNRDIAMGKVSKFLGPIEERAEEPLYSFIARGASGNVATPTASFDEYITQSIKTRVENANKNIVNRQRKIDKATTKVANLKAEMQTLEGTIQSAQVATQEQTNKLLSLKTEVEKREAKIDEAKAKLKKQEAYVESHKTITGFTIQ